MGMEDFSHSQQKIIKRYYAASDDIQLQRLAELVTDLYLSEGKKLDRVWKSVETAMTKLEVPATRISHIMTQLKPELVANLVKELQGKK